MENKELQELNSILQQQVAALKELLAIKEQTIVALRSVQPVIQYHYISYVQQQISPFTVPQYSYVTCETPGTVAIPGQFQGTISGAGGVCTNGGGHASAGLTNNANLLSMVK